MTRDNVKIVNVLASMHSGGSSHSFTGIWRVLKKSKVYFTVATDVDNVNAVFNDVSGQLAVSGTNSRKSFNGFGLVGITSLNTGNSQRDSDVIYSAQYLDASEYPKATLRIETVTGWPDSWVNGRVYHLKISGVMTIKGTAKPAILITDAQYDGMRLRLSGRTQITFEEFGVTDPRMPLDTAHDDLTLTVELILSR